MEEKTIGEPCHQAGHQGQGLVVGVKNYEGPGEHGREDSHLQNRLGAQLLLEEATQYAHEQRRDVFQDD